MSSLVQDYTLLREGCGVLREENWLLFRNCRMQQGRYISHRRLLKRHAIPGSKNHFQVGMFHACILNETFHPFSVTNCHMSRRFHNTHFNLLAYNRIIKATQAENGQMIPMGLRSSLARSRSITFSFSKIRLAYR